MYDIERHCKDSVVPAGLLSRMEQVPGTPLTLRAGLLSGRAYRHFVYTMTTESLRDSRLAMLLTKQVPLA